MGAREWDARGTAVLVQPYAPCLWHATGLREDAPWFFARGEGARLWDDDGREFIDLEMGLGPVLLGYDHPVVREALRRHARIENDRGARAFARDIMAAPPADALR